MELQGKSLQENDVIRFEKDHMILSGHKGIRGRSSPNYSVSLRLRQIQNTNFKEALLRTGEVQSKFSCLYTF